MSSSRKLSSNRYFLFSERGFTLIELIVVITIIGILVTVLLAVINPAQQIRKAHDAQRKSDLKAVQNAIEQYNNDHGSYPKYTTEIFGGNTCTSQWPCWQTSSDSTFLFGQNNTSYMTRLPQDPSYNASANQCVVGTGGYGYYSADGKTYFLFTHLENSNDPAVNPNAGSTISAAGATCGWWANYYVSNQ